MKYNFYKQIISNTGSVYFMCNCEDSKFSVLRLFEFTPSNNNGIQTIIDEIKSTIDTDKEYRWANEDVLLLSDKHGVFFWDLLSMRGSANKKREKQDLFLEHNEFVKFLEDFKTFVEENS